MATIELCRKAALDALRPPPALALADWIESNIFLPSTVSATPGRMRLWAYQRGICEALDDPEISRVTILKSARIGYTSLLTAVIGANVANSPAPILVVQPTSDDARDYATGDVDGVFDASPALRGLLREDADENGRSTMLNRRFPGRVQETHYGLGWRIYRWGDRTLIAHSGYLSGYGAQIVMEPATGFAYIALWNADASAPWRLWPTVMDLRTGDGPGDWLDQLNED